VIKLCKKYGIKMKNQKESQGEDNNFKIGIFPGSRIRRTKENEEDLKLLLCFDYYRRNLIIEADGDNQMNIDLESPIENLTSYPNAEKLERTRILSPKKVNPRINKIKLLMKQNNYYNNNTYRKEFFKIQKRDGDNNIMSQCHEDLMNIVNENQQFMNIYIKNEKIEENVRGLYEFLNSKSNWKDVQNIMTLFDLPNFIENMENSLKMWNQIELDDVALQ
jgi:hypothetical protein